MTTTGPAAAAPKVASGKEGTFKDKDKPESVRNRSYNLKFYLLRF